ncbi:MAG TPA: hypothetical protein PLE36_14050 [Deltaproteobacteria bacterium]|jgi:hypothetical protein|nr:hypothetical protein [Deltaproteobacteria bacterium]NLW66212.1 hypothetical protein [Bacteriovoracaceae bacterium]HOE71937.1 hypothetical protein [Deltaproteobacteria bacterium]HOS28368.1 hypothetical protein [Deltaproteobacteria bacterium]HPX50918.1 hypothetical protein [Deltaproteobacteria bacterium]
MDQKTMVKQAFDFQKSAFDNVYRSMVTIQDQAEKSVSFFLDRVPWMPEESKQLILEWGNMYKKGRDDLKRAVDDGYDKMESYLVSTVEATERAAQQAQQTTRRSAQQASRAASESRKAAEKSSEK